MSTVNQEMLALLEKIYADARGVGTMTQGNAPVNVQEMERVIGLAKGEVKPSAGVRPSAPVATPVDRQAEAAQAKALLAGKK
jgi:hypothetical protein